MFGAAEWIAIGALAVSGVVWLVRLEGRVNGHDRELLTIKEHFEVRDRLLRDDVAYIRSRIDQAVAR